MRDLKNALGGLSVTAIGAAFFIGSHGYDIGSLNSIGPGLLPVAVSILAMFFGMLVAVSDVVRSAGGFQGFDIRSFLCVIAAIASFALLLEPAGILTTTAASVLILSFGADRVNYIEISSMVFTLSTFVWLVFSRGLGMPLYFFPEALL